MAIDAYTDLVPTMNVRLPDCPTNLIQQAVWKAMREFCVDSESYRVKLTAIDSVADQKEYTLTMPTGMEPVRVTEVHVRSEDEVTDGEEGTLQNPSDYDFHFDTNVLEFFTAPFAEVITDGLVVELAVAPTEDGGDSNIDFDWFNRFMPYIRAGAFYELYSMEASPWFSPSQAARYYEEWRRGIGLARRETRTMGTTRGLRMNTNTGAGWL